MTGMTATARQAFARHDWQEALEAFAAADHEASLTADDLRLYADAAWWSGRPDEGTDTLERAFTAYSESGDAANAAIVAVQLTYLAMRRVSYAVAAGWQAKAERLVENEPEGPAHAWLAMIQTGRALFAEGDYAAVITHGQRAVSLARAYDVPEVAAPVLGLMGSARIGMGEWREGLALIDEATAAVAAGELDMRSACDVYCNTISCCTNLGDYQRAAEWTTEAERWMEKRSLGGYPGECRVQRAGVMRMQGQYADAEREARAAGEQLERYRFMDAVGAAHYEIGEIRLRMGDLDAAAQEFSRAYEFGQDAQPGLALVRLAEGDAAGAAEMMRPRLQKTTGDGDVLPVRLDRMRFLPAAVEIALAAGDTTWALVASEELERIASTFERSSFQAAALTARGAVELAEGESHAAVATLDAAWRQWRDADAPYESARARLLLGKARQAAGDPATGVMDLNAARNEFQRLGAARDVETVDLLLGGDAGTSPASGRRGVHTFLFTDIVGSTELVGLIGDDAWHDLLHFHDRLLRREFDRHGGAEVRHTGDGFFVAFDRAQDAIEASVAIQRALAEHRRANGFAPWVRIGMHTAEAIAEGGDFVGAGVHVAARIGALAERNEIMASTATLSAAGTIRFATSSPRPADLKGVDGQVPVASIAWE